MADQMKSYTVRYERDETGWWVASVPSVKGCHTQGRSIKQARTRIREALGLFISNASDVELIDDVKLPVHVLKLVKQTIDDRKTADIAASNLVKAQIKAAEMLTRKLGVSVRDAGEVLGISYQRVAQILPPSVTKKKKRIVADHGIKA
jgi:predicted RNase H-like HicB family nuclease